MKKDFRDILYEEKLPPGVNDYLFADILVRKPVRLSDLNRSTPLNKMPKEVQKFIKGLKMITFPDLFTGPDNPSGKPQSGMEFSGGFDLASGGSPPQWFKIKMGKNIILVDTEGYNYIRYGAKIK